MLQPTRLSYGAANAARKPVDVKRESWTADQSGDEREVGQQIELVGEAEAGDSIAWQVDELAVDIVDERHHDRNLRWRRRRAAPRRRVATYAPFAEAS